MASRLYSVEEVVASMQDRMEIPGPVDDGDDWSGDEFDGYVNSDDEEAGDDEEDAVMGEEEDNDSAGGERRDDESVQHGIPAYSCSPGCTQPLGDGSPLHFFSMLVTDDMLDNIVEQTNLYASQYVDTHTITPRSRVQQWSRQEFDRDELKKFLALVIVMGLVNLPTMEDHWVTTWPYSSQTCSKVCMHNCNAHRSNTEKATYAFTCRS